MTSVRYRLLLVSSLLALSIPPRAMRAQTSPPADSVLAIMLSPVLVRLLDHEIAAAGRGRRHVIKIDLPKPDPWPSVTTHLLTITNGRAPTPRDSLYDAITIKGIRVTGDTIVAAIEKETWNLCPKKRWMTTGTAYDVRIVRVGLGWTQPRVTPGLTWDAFGCPDA